MGTIVIQLLVYYIYIYIYRWDGVTLASVDRWIMGRHGGARLYVGCHAIFGCYHILFWEWAIYLWDLITMGMDLCGYDLDGDLWCYGYAMLMIMWYALMGL